MDGREYRRLPDLIRVARARADWDGRRRKIVSVKTRGGWIYAIRHGEGHRQNGRWPAPERRRP